MDLKDYDGWIVNNLNIKNEIINSCYMDEKETSSIYENKFLDDSIDNMINDSVINNKIITYINSIKNLILSLNMSKKPNINNDMFIYDMGFLVGKLSEIFPKYRQKKIYIIRDLFKNKNYNEIINNCNNILKNYPLIYKNIL